jgi:hypothetical protein
MITKDLQLLILLITALIFIGIPLIYIVCRIIFTAFFKTREQFKEEWWIGKAAAAAA